MLASMGPDPRTSLESSLLSCSFIMEAWDKLLIHRRSDILERDRTPADQAKPSVDQWTGRANEQDNQRRNGETVSLRQPRSASRPSQRLPKRLQFCTSAEDTERSHDVRVHLQNLDIRTRSIHPKSDPPDVGTEHLVISICK